MAGSTLKIAMRYQISGLRHDGRAWPPPGEEFEVPAWEAHDLFRGEHADPVGQEARDAWKDEQDQAAGDRHPSKLDRDPRPPSQVEAEDSQPDSTGGEDAPDSEDEPEAEAAPAAPAPGAPKQAWVDWALSQGGDVHAVNSMTKADLMSRYGGRL